MNRMKGQGDRRASVPSKTSDASRLEPQEATFAQSRPFTYEHGFQMLSLLRRVAIEADGTDLETGRYAISCDLLDNINDLLLAIMPPDAPPQPSSPGSTRRS